MVCQYLSQQLDQVLLVAKLFDQLLLSAVLAIAADPADADATRVGRGRPGGRTRAYGAGASSFACFICKLHPAG